MKQFQQIQEAHDALAELRASAKRSRDKCTPQQNFGTTTLHTSRSLAPYPALPVCHHWIVRDKIRSDQMLDRQRQHVGNQRMPRVPRQRHDPAGAARAAVVCAGNFAPGWQWHGHGARAPLGSDLGLGEVCGHLRWVSPSCLRALALRSSPRPCY